MTRRYSLPAPQEAPAARLHVRIGRHLLHTRSGRVLSAALSLLALHAAIGIPEPLVVLATLAAVLLGLLPLARWLVRKLLWRIRTKLIVSYLFIAVVPVLLLTLFFFIAGLISLTLVGSYMVSSQLARTAQQLETVAHTALEGLEAEAGTGTLARRLAALEELHPEPAFALFRGGALVAARGAAPRELPAWLREKGRFAGFVGGRSGPGLLRGAWQAGDRALVVEVPVDARLAEAIHARTGIRIDPVRAFERRGRRGRRADDEDRDDIEVRIDPSAADSDMHSVAIVDAVDWESGRSQVQPFAIRLAPMRVLETLTPATRELSGTMLVQALGIVGGFFLVVYAMALGVGLLLARSITRSVHELSKGTERLRDGRLDTLVRVTSRDQLGELAESFNTMARGLQDLLRENAEKERLEEELRIARQIQMSLLPQNVVALPGLRIAALCLPAAEVGGDYYDILPLSESRMGVLVADVSGKGTSAALYMAELKGLILSLSRVYDSPAALLREANRILAAHLDARSFVTMTYAVVDVERRRMRYARAGHNPLLHFEARTGRTRVLAPQGLGLGIDKGTTFDAVLEEAEAPLASGDVFLFFTDGLSEAMNASAELFGERRLRDVLEQSERLSSEELKERILEEIRRFAGGAAQHDDLTLVVLKVV